MDEISNNYISNLKELRAKAGLTQPDVERALGMRKLMMRDYEAGRLKLPIHVAAELAKLYRVSLDELVGNTPKKELDTKRFSNFKSLFVGNGMGPMFFDPIIRGALEDCADKAFELSIFEMLTLDYSLKKKSNLILEVSKFLSSLAGIDGRIADEEVYFTKFLLSSFDIDGKYKELAKVITSPYLPEEVPCELKKLEVRHFLIWIMFFFANSDGDVAYQELEYIERCAEKLKINKSNYLFIKEKFIKEQVS